MNVSEALGRLSGDAREATEEAAVPDWTSPMLATLTDDCFSDPDWVFERKLDGVRLLAFRDEADVRLLTRNREERRSTYPDVAEALESQGGDRFVADGEVVAFEDDDTSFERLQARMRIDDPEEARASDVSAFYSLFDLLHLDGRELSDALEERERETSPFADGAGPSGQGVHWARPELVAEVGFTEWTDGGKLRPSRFEGLHRDKDAEDVVRERPEESPA